MSDYKLQTAELLIRVFTGIVFLFQGYDKLFIVKMRGVIEAYRVEADQKHIPGAFVTLMAYYTSIIEFFGGIFLILGLFTTYTLYLLGLDLLLVCFAFSYMKAMWDMKHVFPRFILIVMLLVLPDEYCKFSFDYLLK